MVENEVVWPDGARRLPPRARRLKVLEMIREYRSVSVARLARDLRVSSVTIHRDLAELEERGLVRRVQGGAITRPAEDTARFKTAWHERLQARQMPKARMALTAHRLLEPRSTVFLDGSTTAFALAAAIEADPKHLTVVTVCPLIAHGLLARDVQVVIAPGYLDREMRTIVGRWTSEFLANLNLSATFLSGAGFTLEHGLTTTRRDLSQVAQQTLRRASHAVCLVDSSKIGKTAMLTVAAARDFSAVVTDDELDPAASRQLLEAGVKLVQPDEDREAAERLVHTSSLWALATRPHDAQAGLGPADWNTVQPALLGDNRS